MLTLHSFIIPPGREHRMLDLGRKLEWLEKRAWRREVTNEEGLC